MFFKDSSREKINKISFFCDMEYDEHVNQLKMNQFEVPADYKIDKKGLCNFVSLSNYDGNSIVGLVTILEKKSARIIIKNCLIPKSGVYFHVFNKNEA